MTLFFFVTNKSLRAGYHDFLVRRLCGVCCSAVSNVKTVSQSISQSVSQPVKARSKYLL